MKLIFFFVALFGGTWQEYPMASGDSIYRLVSYHLASEAYTSMEEFPQLFFNSESVFPLAQMIRVYTPDADTFLSMHYIPLFLHKPEFEDIVVRLDATITLTKVGEKKENIGSYEGVEALLYELGYSDALRDFGRPESPASLWNTSMFVEYSDVLHKFYPTKTFLSIESVSTD